MDELSRQERSWMLKQAIREVLDDPMRQAELKDLLKQALTEWLENKWAAFGKWSFRGVGAMAFIAILYLYGRAKGFL